MLTLKDKIKEAGLKATPQRMAIYSAMQHLGHASADMVVEELRKNFPTLTVATIYNVLESFTNAGLLQKRFSSNNKMYFDVNTCRHAHMYDENDNSFIDYNDPGLIDIVLDYLKDKKIEGFDIRKVDIQLVGTKTAL